MGFGYLIHKAEKVKRWVNRESPTLYQRLSGPCIRALFSGSERQLNASLLQGRTMFFNPNSGLSKRFINKYNFS